jgi:sRNA-binding protein
LKIGIDDDLAMRCPALQRRERDVVLRLYTWRLAYVKACVEGAARYDLDGNVSGVVSATHAGHAIAKRTTILARRAAQLAAVKTARHETRKRVKPATPQPSPAVTAPSPAPEPTPTLEAIRGSTPKQRPVLRLPAVRQAAS